MDIVVKDDMGRDTVESVGAQGPVGSSKHKLPAYEYSH